MTTEKVERSFVLHAAHEQAALKIVPRPLRSSLSLFLLLFVLPQTEALLRAQSVSNLSLADAADPGRTVDSLNAPQHRLKAAAELRVQEHQRILGVMPNFNTSNLTNAEPLAPGQKFDLAAKTAFDPFTFALAGLDSAVSQAENDFPEYHQGAPGYGKRFGAAYADSFNSNLLGNALFPVILRQDPRYFRKATGSFSSRFRYALVSTVKCKDDNGKWAPNYSNVLGNITAGGISNLYYPSSDRGAGLTFERAATVTAEGAIGAVFEEFWPDISRKLFSKHHFSNAP